MEKAASFGCSLLYVLLCGSQRWTPSPHLSKLTSFLWASLSLATLPLTFWMDTQPPIHSPAPGDSRITSWRLHFRPPSKTLGSLSATGKHSSPSSTTPPLPQPQSSQTRSLSPAFALSKRFASPRSLAVHHLLRLPQLPRLHRERERGVTRIRRTVAGRVAFPSCLSLFLALSRRGGTHWSCSSLLYSVWR